MENKSNDIEILFHELLNSLTNTEHLYRDFLQIDYKTYPIPFFGNIESAKVITVGINPASSEFRATRNWPQNINVEYLIHRLHNYFNFPGIPPHSWFSRWEMALNLLDLSFYSGVAAHIDLSPRPTINLGKIDNVNLFEQMVEHDLIWFLKLLNYCRSLKLLLIAGAVTKRYYINEFIKKHCHQYGFRLEGEFKRIDNPGSGKTTFHRLIGHGIDLPVFFCSVSPSANNSNLLVEKIRDNQTKLHELAHY